MNTFVGMAIDLERMRSKLGKATGGLSGPAIKPMALARCHEAAHAVRIPVIGSGGISSGRDALEFIAAGAAAVQVGTTAITRLDFIVLIPVWNLRPRVEHGSLLGHAPANTGGHAGAGSLWLGSAASDSLCAP